MRRTTMKIYEDQITKCQTNTVGYIKWHEESDKKMTKGEKQHYCSHCQRYKWDDEMCFYGRLDKLQKQRKKEMKK